MPLLEDQSAVSASGRSGRCLLRMRDSRAGAWAGGGLGACARALRVSGGLYSVKNAEFLGFLRQLGNAGGSSRIFSVAGRGSTRRMDSARKGRSMSRSNPDWSQDAHGKAAHIEALLAERQWVQRLALSLVGDPHLADDIAQETLVAGLTRLPRHAGALRSWLAQVARNFSRRSHRDSGTRRRHEARREHARSGGEPEDFVERAEEQHRLVGAVLRLEEPFRSTVIEHYFEGRTPLAIARRSGVPAGTVRSRLKRGLDRLRAQLRPDENQPWAPAILALAAGAGVGPSAAGGTLGRWVAAAIVAFALAGGGWLIFRGDPGPAVVASSRDIFVCVFCIS